jgi:hypothetical protein
LERIEGAPPEKVSRLLRDVAAHEHYLELLGQPGLSVSGYLEYLDEGRRGQPLVADITPAYSLLTEERLKMMGQIAPDVRFLYILRDPVERLWSHVRMMAARRAPDGQATPVRAARILNRVLNGAETQIEDRSDYQTALLKLALAVDVGKLCVTTCDEMFTQAGVDRICDFLGIRRRPARVKQRVHSGPEIEMSADHHAAARAWLEPQYAFLREAVPGILHDDEALHPSPA